MHSSSLRGSDFKIVWRGDAVSHANFFTKVRDTDRVGVVIPHALDGIGAITLIMAYVTAFYDRYRERGSDFYAYPDFFRFKAKPRAPIIARSISGQAIRTFTFQPMRRK